MRFLPSRGQIVACLVQARRPLHAREVAARCQVEEGAYSALLELLDRLALDGTVRRLPGSRFRAQASQERATESVEGALAMNPRGFGFVTGGDGDVYVAPDGIGGALHGDRVRATIISRTARGLEGLITEIVARRSPRVAGTLRRRGSSLWLEPDDTRLRGPIVIPTDSSQGQDGDAAVVAITRFPDRLDENPEGELVTALGTPGDPQVEVAKILVREAVEEAHPPEVLKEAAEQCAALERSPVDDRLDLTGVPLPTIDPEDARDHDDAIWVERLGDGYRVVVAIADVAEYVQAGGALDQEAARRGCTIYLPDRAIPMLPEALAATACSLIKGQDRLCLAVVATLDDRAKVRQFEVVEAVMRSCASLTYGGVARALGLLAAGPREEDADRLRIELAVADELARRLRRQRLRRGALDLDLPEAQVLLDESTGAPVGIVRRSSDPGLKRAYQIVEELMLLANELVARWLTEKGCPTVYRVHAPPDPEKLERLGQVCKVLDVPFDADRVQERGGVSEWLLTLEGHPSKGVLTSLLLRSLKQATYDPHNIGHYGLASSQYLHFTSPIRRYPDLLVHRAVKGLLHGRRPDPSPQAQELLGAAAASASARERATADIEREVVDLYRAVHMQDRIGEHYTATVTGIGGGGVYATLDDPFVDVLIRLDALGPDQYELSEDELRVVGQRSGDTIALGDRVQVVIEDVAILRRTVYAKRVVEGHTAGRAPRRLGRGRRAIATTGSLKDKRSRRGGGTQADGENPRRRLQSRIEPKTLRSRPKEGGRSRKRRRS